MLTKPKFKKIRWTEDQKQVTIKYFKDLIINKKPPTQYQINIFKEKYPVMINKDWKKIKAFIFNKYQGKTCQLGM